MPNFIRRRIRRVAVAVCATLAVAGCSATRRVPALTAFASDKALDQYVSEALRAERAALDWDERQSARGLGTIVVRTHRSWTGRISDFVRRIDRDVVIDVTVRDSHSARALEGASVRLAPAGAQKAAASLPDVDKGTRAPVPTFTVSTDAAGRGRIHIPASQFHHVDQWQVLVRRIGYERSTRQLHIRKGDSVTVSARLRPSTLMLQSVVSNSADAPSVTNVQEAGIDEGGLVKVHGEHLVMLRHGRLISASMENDVLALTDTLSLSRVVPAVGGDWFDELLVVGDRVVVTGYSYDSGTTNFLVLDIDTAGRLHAHGSYQLRSSDYWSSRDYATRVVGSRLLIYAHDRLERDAQGVLIGLPALRTWHRGKAEGFRQLLNAARLYRLPAVSDPMPRLTVHSIITCDVAAPTLACTAVGIVGPDPGTLYVSPQAAYIALSDVRRRQRDRHEDFVVRVPHGDGRPSAARIAGSPVDQFSFSEDSVGSLRMLVRGGSRGAAMWNAEFAGGDAHLLSLPASRFGRGTESLVMRDYIALPLNTSLQSETFTNRFVGNRLLYGVSTRTLWTSSASSPAPITSNAYVADVGTGRIDSVPLPGGVERIEPFGAHALIAGSDTGALTISVLDVTARARPLAQFRVAGAAQAETRSHAFGMSATAERTLLALPVQDITAPSSINRRAPQGAMLYVGWSGRFFTPAGTLTPSNQHGPSNGECEVSCIDWYGNTRPLFIGGRVFALLGNELVEGELVNGRLVERRRLQLRPTSSPP